MERIEPKDSSVLADSRQKAILDNLGLVYYVYGRMNLNLPAGMEPEDAISYGILGLIEAFDRFDVSKGRFATYAYPRIQGAILDGVAKYIWARKPDVRLYNQFAQYGSSAPFIVEESSLSEERKNHVLTTLSNSIPLSLDTLSNVEMLLSADFLSELEEKAETNYLVLQTFKLLTKEEKEILWLRVVLKKPFYTIAKHMKVNASTVCRRYNHAICRVRKYFQEHPL